MSEHIFREMEKLKKKILRLSAMVEERVQTSVQCLNENNASLGQKVVEGDMEIDQMEVEIEEDCLKILALYQPVATDLRLVVAVLKINADLERIGDLAVNIAERAIYLARHHLPFEVKQFADMSQKSQAMLRLALDSLMTRDTVLARRVCTLDDEVDAINRGIFAFVHAAIRKTPELVEPLIHLLSISRHLERIADYATNIAEDVIYMIDGEIIRHRVEVYIAAAEGSKKT